MELSLCQAIADSARRHGRDRPLRRDDVAVMRGDELEMVAVDVVEEVG